MFAAAFTRTVPRFAIRAVGTPSLVTPSLLSSSVRNTAAAAFANSGSITKRFNSSSSASQLAAENELNKEAAPFKFSGGPVEVRYTEEHEWIALHPDGTAFVGITKYAADALGDATFVELPAVGDAVEKSESVGSVESVKSASEVYSPVNGEVTGVNEAVAENPALLNKDPLGEGWLTQIQVGSVEEDFTNNDSLLTLQDYAKSLEEDH